MNLRQDPVWTVTIATEAKFLPEKKKKKEKIGGMSPLFNYLRAFWVLPSLFIKSTTQKEDEKFFYLIAYPTIEPLGCNLTGIFPSFLVPSTPLYPLPPPSEDFNQLLAKDSSMKWEHTAHTHEKFLWICKRVSTVVESRRGYTILNVSHFCEEKDEWEESHAWIRA